MPEFLSPRARLLLFTVIVAFILTIMMEIFNVELFFGGYYTRALLAITIALAIYIMFERISERISHNCKIVCTLSMYYSTCKSVNVAVWVGSNFSSLSLKLTNWKTN